MTLEFVNTQNHFFSDRTSLAIPSAFVRLGSFKRGSMYMSPHAASTTFFKNFYDCLQTTFPQQDTNTFFLVFLLSTPFPHPAEAVSEPKRTTYIPMTIWPPIMHRFHDIPFSPMR